MQKFKCFLFAILCMVLLGIVATAEGDQFKLYYNIDFEENMVFDKYDMDLYIDGEQIASLPHGRHFTLMTEAEKGNHTIYFSKTDDSEVNGSTTINLKGDASFVCSIRAEGKKVNITKFELTDDISAASIEMPDVSLWYLKDAEKELKDLGYININLASEEGKSISSSNDWIVLKQNIESGKCIDQNEEIALTAQKVQDFLNSEFVGKTVMEAGKTAEENRFFVLYVDKLNDTGITDKLHDEKSQKEWIVSEAALKASNQRLVKLGLEYTGSSVVPDVTHMELSHAIKRLHEEGFQNLSYITKDKNEIKEKHASDYFVISMNKNIGAETKINTEICLTCEPYSELSEENLITVPEILTETAEAETESETESETEAKETELQTEAVTEKITEIATEITVVPETEKMTEKETEIETEKTYSDADTIKEVQTALNKVGYDCGTPDGIAGGATTAAITAYAMAKGISCEDGKITDKLLTQLKADEYTAKMQEDNMKQTEKETEAPVASEPEHDYILNTNSYKFHYPGCASVNKMAEHNKEYYTGTRSYLIDIRGFSPCGNCNP